MRMRPRTLDEFVGQKHFIGEGKLLRRCLEADRLTSAVFYGPPGTGKTTLASVIAETTKSHFDSVNAASVGVKEIRDILIKPSRAGCARRNSILRRSASIRVHLRLGRGLSKPSQPLRAFLAPRPRLDPVIFIDQLGQRRPRPQPAGPRAKRAVDSSPVFPRGHANRP